MQNKNGFTLLETLVALVITVSAAILLANAWSSNYSRIRKTTLNNNIAQLLARKMTEMEAKYSDKQFGEIKDEEGDFGKEYENYRWEFKTQPFVMPDLTPLLSSDDKPADSTVVMVISKMQEAMGKAILEARVTVFVKVAGREIKHSVTTYFVDYDTEPNLSIN